VRRGGLSRAPFRKVENKLGLSAIQNWIRRALIFQSYLRAGERVDVHSVAAVGRNPPVNHMGTMTS
jgi:hypothetical protein